MAIQATQAGGQIARLRRAKGLTQTALGELLKVSFQAVSKWERGETLPDTALLDDLAQALDRSAQIASLQGKLFMI